MTPKGFEPKDDKSRREDCCPDHDAKRGERLLLACRKPGQVLLNQVEFLHHLREGFAQCIDLTKGEAGGIDVGHVARAAVGIQRKVAHCWLIPDYRASLAERI